MENELIKEVIEAIEEAIAEISCHVEIPLYLIVVKTKLEMVLKLQESQQSLLISNSKRN